MSSDASEVPDMLAVPDMLVSLNVVRARKRAAAQGGGGRSPRLSDAKEGVAASLQSLAASRSTLVRLRIYMFSLSRARALSLSLARALPLSHTHTHHTLGPWTWHTRRRDERCSG
jgi:hypothetical protein